MAKSSTDWEWNVVCHQIHKTSSAGMFAGHNPLAFAVPLLLLQIFFVSFTALCFNAVLKPLGIPIMSSQILAGIILGPSVMGNIDNFVLYVFPKRSLEVLDTFALFGAIFYLFLIGVQMDLSLLKSGRKALFIGSSVVMLALLLSTTFAIIVAETLKYDAIAWRSLLMVATVESMVSYPVVAYVLSEIKIVHSEFSIVALSSAMVSSLICFTIVTIIVLVHMSEGSIVVLLKLASKSGAVVLFIGLILRPLVLSMIRQIPGGQTMKEAHMCFIFLCIMGLAYASRKAGMHMFLGPFILGLVLPSGPPLAPALLERLEFFILWIVMPLFYARRGMIVNVYDIRFKKFLTVGLVVIISCIGKFVGALLPSMYYNMSSNDSILLGLTMNVQGFVELSLFKWLSDFKLIEEESFQIMSISMLLITGAFIPLVRSLYKSSRKFVLHRRRTIEHSPANTEFRVLACVHDQLNVPSIIHLLKASYPTEHNPISVSVIHLVELVGRATPMLVSHKASKGNANNATSQRIINVFKRYEENNAGNVSVHPFTMTSSYETMHDNICMLAFNKMTCLIILPYHKQYSTGVINTQTKVMNGKIIDNAPCSVGILIDRGLLGGYKFVLANWLSYHVVIIFLGGADDREALAYGLRMAGHPNINLTILRFLDTAHRSMNEMNRILDDASVNDFKTKTAYNNRVTYMVEEVVDREGVMEVVDSMEGNFELIVMGRRHDKESSHVLGRADWKNCTDLGTLGDTFISEDYGGRATILVMQQQTNLSNRTPNSSEIAN